MFSHSELICGYSLENPICQIPPLSYPKGALIAIMGPNGAGKSTFIRTLAGLLTPLQGKVIFDDSLVKRSAEDGGVLRTFTSNGGVRIPLERIVSLVLSERPQCDYQTVLEVAKLGLEAWRGGGTQKFLQRRNLPFDAEMLIQSALEATQLSLLENRLANTLSDGEFKRLMIARAIIQNTPIMLLDEPLSFLDPPNKAIILKLLKTLSQQGKTILFSTHDPSFSLQISDFLLLIPQKNTHPSSFHSLSKGILPEIITALSNTFPSKDLRFNPQLSDFQFR